MIHGPGAEYRFQHYRSLDPRDESAPKELIWASKLGEIEQGVRQGSKAEHKILREQSYTHNFLTDGGESAMLDVFFRAGAAPTFYFALYNATPAETSTMALTTEVTGTGYARISVARNATDFPSLTLDAGDFKVTSATKTFSATGPWTSATHLALVSTASGTSGTLYAIVPLSGTRVLASGDSLNVSFGVKLS